MANYDATIVKFIKRVSALVAASINTEDVTKKGRGYNRTMQRSRGQINDGDSAAAKENFVAPGRPDIQAENLPQPQIISGAHFLCILSHFHILCVNPFSMPWAGGSGWLPCYHRGV